MRLSVEKFIFCLTLVILCGYAHASRVNRDVPGEENSLAPSPISRLANTIINGIAEIPLIGGEIARVLRWIKRFVDVFEVGSNGAIARLLGGALPCTITLGGTSCSGITNNGGFEKLLMSVLDDVPSLILPGFVKSLIKLSIEMFADPIADVLFGGVVVNAKQ